MTKYPYRANGSAAGFINGKYIHDMHGNAIGQINGSLYISYQVDMWVNYIKTW